MGGETAFGGLVSRMAKVSEPNAAAGAEPQRASPDAANPAPETKAAPLSNADEAWPVRVIRRGDTVRPLPPHARSLEDLTFEVAGALVRVDDFMARRHTAGLLVLKDGEIALERYGMDSGPERRRTSYSTAKSITSTLVGAALHEGAIGGLDERCDLYLPRLRGSAYEGVTVRNVLRMCSGVAWNELGDGVAGACKRPWRAGGQAPSWASRAPCRGRIRKEQSSTIRPSRAACWAPWSPPRPASRWPTTAPR